MAKRKRLTPASTAFLEAAPETKSAAPMRAPIADVAREAAGSAVAEELAQTLTQARTEGRMVLSVPLEAIDLNYLVRDRLVAQDGEMQSLKESLSARGQQTPVELVALDGGRYGLISGWRRCAALRALHQETGEDRFATVLGLLRQPAEHADAYLAMVEENEIRVGLSYYERARIVAKSVEQGVFEEDRQALQILFQSASRAKRSKIGSFLIVVRALDGLLQYPQALGERQGLQMARAMAQDAGVTKRLVDTLAARCAPDAQTESQMLQDALAGPAKSSPPAPTQDGRIVGDGVRLLRSKDQIVLKGRGVTKDLENRLTTWLVKNI